MRWGYIQKSSRPTSEQKKSPLKKKKQGLPNCQNKCLNLKTCLDYCLQITFDLTDFFSFIQVLIYIKQNSIIILLKLYLYIKVSKINYKFILLNIIK